jgi:predicted nucleotide-binding protein (sugar kinase/HSP70/actin superfamily)
MEGILEQAFNAGEGWLMPGEIISMIKKGADSFVVVQPFGCLPNHISGRGMIKAIKKKYPHIQILPLDFDPDISLGNIENRLQMLIINARQIQKQKRNIQDY